MSGRAENNLVRLEFPEQPPVIPPQDLAAETAVLASVLLDQGAMARVAPMLDVRDFYGEANGRVFAAMRALFDRGEPIDFLTLTDELGRTNMLDAAGGDVHLSGLLSAFVLPANAERHARLVADRATMRRLISAGGKIAAMGMADSLTVQAAVEKAEQLVFDVAARTAGREHRPLGEILSEYLERLSALQDGTASGFAVPSGYGDLDRILKGGFQRSNLVLLAARPGMGKTSMCMGIAANVALNFGAGVAVFSLEMGAMELVARLLASESGIDTGRLSAGGWTDRESRMLGHAIDRLVQAPVLIDDTSMLTVGELRSKVRRMQSERPIDLVVVDHIQLLSGGVPNANRVQEMTEISRQLKVLAREQHVAVLALSQLSREVERRPKKVPQLSDLRESGSLEQDADVVLFLYRDDYYHRESERQGIADVHVAKHRDGPTGQVSLLFNSRTTRFLDLDVDRRS